jgi:hypothetical protein
MRTLKIKPQLVDHTLLKKISPQQPEINITKIIPKRLPNFSVYFNIIAVCILLIGGILLYQRYHDRILMKQEYQHNVIKLNQYVQERIDS